MKRSETSKITVYKAVFNGISGLESVIMLCGDQGSSGVIYHKGQWVHPQKDCGPLCAFSMQKAARNWAKRLPSELWEALAVPSIHGYVWGKCDGHRKLADLPKGTVLCDAIKLIRRLE